VNLLATRVAASIAQVGGKTSHSARMSSMCRRPLRGQPTETAAFEWMSAEKDVVREATPFDWALYISVSTFAVHQQGKTTPMNVRGKAFGTALKELADLRELAPVERRAFSVLQASQPKRLTTNLRALIAMLRDADIGFDYVRFAYDLEALLNPAADSSAVSRAWGRDLHRPAFRSSSTSTPVLRTT
jgi:CRISPR type I-E-associated protein CasB/Cse2